MKTNAEVCLWGSVIGAVSLDEASATASFEYDSSFLGSSIEVSPLVMPLKRGIYRFPDLSYESYFGLPGLLSDSLPDKFGNSIIDLWLAKQGRLPGSMNAVEKLCYTGKRGMGALEYYPVIKSEDINESLNVSELVNLASMVLQNRNNLQTVLDERGVSEIISVGTSAGGARAKAVVLWNPVTNEVRSGQADISEGFENWIIKFSGISGNRDKEDEDGKDFSLIEYAYYLMAKEAKINMMECRTFKDGSNTHFMTKRFDRTNKGEKIHMQSLCAIAHMDFNQAGRYSYEQVFSVLNRIGAPHQDRAEVFRRMVFNVLSFNCDDHTKNMSFLMDKRGQWNLSPAYDVTFAYNPAGLWTSSHQMTVNGKRRNITEYDFEECARMGNLSSMEIRNTIAEVKSAVSRWKEYAQLAGLSERRTQEIWDIIKLEK